MFKSQIIKLAGVSFDGAQENIRQWGCRDIGTYAMVRDLDNPHDKNAIKVALFGHYFMGYVPRYLARTLAPMMDAGRTFIAEFVARNEAPGQPLIGLTIRIVETTPTQ